MKIYRLTIVAIIILIGITSFNSCTIEEPTNAETVTISSDINSTTTWAGNKIYIIDKDNLYLNAELTIEAGAIIKIMTGGNIILNRNGNIIANGTSAKPIVFTSIKDDNNGSDENGDGDKLFPLLATGATST